MSDLDLRDWYTKGEWVASEDEGLTLARSAASAEEIARDHNALVAEVKRLRGLYDGRKANWKLALGERDVLAAKLAEVARERDELRWSLDGARNRLAGTDKLDAQLVAAEARLEAVRELHFERKGVCWSCPNHDWPCPTASALAVPAGTAQPDVWADPINMAKYGQPAQPEEEQP